MRKENTAFLPNDLTENEIQDVIGFIEETDKKNSEFENDFVLVDKINGKVNIKYLKYDKIMKICKTTNETPYEVCMEIMRGQNEDIVSISNMDESKISFKDEFGSFRTFYFDDIIIGGLYRALFHNVEKNNKEFDIEIDTPTNQNSIASKISKRGNIVIMTNCLASNIFVQFLIGENINLVELKAVSNEILPVEFKNGILEAVKLRGRQTLGDLFNLSDDE